MAVAGVSFAQVSLTGNLIMGYKATTSAKLGNPQASGFGVDTSEIDLTVKEDMGGGQSIEAKMALAGADRSGESTNGSVGGRDATLSYTNNSFGRIQLGSTRDVNYFAGIASAGAPVIDMDGKLFETRSSSDFISYTVPVGPVYVNISHAEGSAGLGLGQGVTGSATLAPNYQRKNTYSVYYGAGPVVLLGAYRTYDNRKPGDVTTAAGTFEALSGTKNDVVNVQGSYDFGVAKVGLGYQVANGSNGVHVTDALLGASMPVGAWTFGATVARSAATDAPNTSTFTGGFWDLRKYEGTATGYSVGASYALSKRTSISAKYASWTHSGYSQYENDAPFKAANITTSSGIDYSRTANETSILLSHAF